MLDRAFGIHLVKIEKLVGFICVPVTRKKYGIDLLFSVKAAVS